MIISAIGNMIIPLLQQRIIDDGIIAKDLNELSKLVLISIAIYLMISAITYFENKVQISINYDFIKSLQLKVMNHLFRIKENHLEREGVLKLSKNADYCIQTLSQMTSNSVLQLLLEIFKFIGIIIALIIINWKLALISLLFIPIKLITTIIISRFAQIYSEQNVQEHQSLHKWEEDVYSTIPEIKLWNLYNLKNKEYNFLINKIFALLKRSSLLGVKDTQIGEVLSHIIFSLLYLFAGLMIWRNTLSIGGLLVVISYFSYVLEPVSLFASINLIYAGIKPAIDKFDEYMNLPEENNKDSNKKLIDLKINGVNLDLSLVNISFQYGEKKILDRISLDIESGDKVALIGENGVGKTTLIDILLRFIEPTEGNILINGIDFYAYPVDCYRELFSVVTQAPNLFNASIKDNLTVFDKYNLDMKILKLPLFDFINRLQNKIQSEVGNRATMLSGGEKQKIALGRCLMKHPSIMILDEPTSNYDSESKNQFLDLLLDINFTVVIISHDLEILKVVDKIILLENGHAHLFEDYNSYINSIYCIFKEDKS